MQQRPLVPHQTDCPAWTPVSREQLHSELASIRLSLFLGGVTMLALCEECAASSFLANLSLGGSGGMVRMLGSVPNILVVR